MDSEGESKGKLTVEGSREGLGQTASMAEVAPVQTVQNTSSIDSSQNDGIQIPSLESIEQERDRLNIQEKRNNALRGTVFILIVIAAAAVLTITLLFPILKVAGESMQPTLDDNDVVIMSKFGDFETGDLVGFYFQNKLLIKRVIGGPGDWIDIDDDGNVSVNGVVLDEPYVVEKSLGETDIELPYQVPENRYFVMGDHRSVSIDSRSSVIGTVEKDQIVGRILLRVWPIQSFSLLK